MSRIVTLALAIFATVSCVGLAACSRGDDVAYYLNRWNETHLIEVGDLSRIRERPGHGLPELAKYLNDKDLGYVTESAMTEIDAFGAVPYLIQNLPNRDINVQRDGFRNANRMIREYELSVIAKEKKPDPTARWSRNTRPFPYRRQLHDAAIRAALSDETRDSEAEIIQSIGLTGSRRDIGLLKKIAAIHADTAWLCTAAAARLGDLDAIRSIEGALLEPVAAKPAEPYYRDSGGKVQPAPGAVVASLADGTRIRIATFQAAFTMNRRFVPLLLSHVDDPAGQFHGDYGDPSPGALARDALSTVILGREYSAWPAEDWKAWATRSR